MSKCKGCNAEIVWMKTKAGKNIPVDADCVEQDDTGKYPMEFDTETMTCHFETCKEAAQFRKGASK